MAGEIYPKFPGKGADKGWYQTDKGSRYYAGGNEFRYSDPQGRTNLGGMFGGIFSPKPLSAEQQALSDKKTAWLNSDRKGPNPYLSSPRSEKVVSPTNNQPNNAAEINARLAQQKKEREAALAVTKGDYDHSSGGYTGQDVALVPDSTVDTVAPVNTVAPVDTVYSRSGVGNRNNSRVIPGSGGKVQKGTDMGRSFNDLLAAQGNERYGAFSSNQLPTTGANPFEGTAPKTQSFNPAAPGITGQSYDNYGAAGGVAAASSTDRSQFNPMSGKEGRIEGASERRKGGSLADALNDTAGINSYMSKFSSGDRQRAARSAFLNAEDSLSGLQARDAVNDVVYAGGQHYGRDGDGTFKLDRADARQVASGKAQAQDFLKSKIDTTIDAQKQTPAEAQDPLSAAGSAVKSGFAAGAQTDFSLNNNQSAPQAGVGPVVPTDQIPKDLSGAAGKKYLADLDAGKLF